LKSKFDTYRQDIDKILGLKRRMIYLIDGD